jgi:hypothetical protein
MSNYFLENRTSFRIPADILESIRDEATEWSKVETGGMLFGDIHEYKDSVSIVVKKAASIPDEECYRSTGFFGIDSGYAREVVDQQTSENKYLGNWHTHLGYGGSSKGDHQQILQFFSDNEFRDYIISIILDHNEGAQSSKSDYRIILEVYHIDTDDKVHMLRVDDDYGHINSDGQKMRCSIENPGVDGIKLAQLTNETL